MNTSALTVTLNPAIDQTIRLETLHHSKVNIAQTMDVHAAGKGINVATCLADYGIATTAFGVIGSENKHLFEQHFQQRGVTDACLRIDGATRTNVKLVEKDGTTTDVNLPGIPVYSDTLSSVLDHLQNAIRPGIPVVLSGSLPPGLDENAWAQVQAHAIKAGARLVLDTSGVALKRALDAPENQRPYAVKPNKQELQAIVGHCLDGRQNVIDAARALLAKHITLVVISMGADGALFAMGQEAIIAKPNHIVRSSTVGAGDAMVAGLTAGIIANNISLESCARLATAFSICRLTNGYDHPIEKSKIHLCAQKAVNIEHLTS